MARGGQPGHIEGTTCGPIASACGHCRYAVPLSTSAQCEATDLLHTRSTPKIRENRGCRQLSTVSTTVTNTPPCLITIQTTFHLSPSSALRQLLCCKSDHPKAPPPAPQIPNKAHPERFPLPPTSYPPAFSPQNQAECGGRVELSSSPGFRHRLKLGSIRSAGALSTTLRNSPPLGHGSRVSLPSSPSAAGPMS